MNVRDSELVIAQFLNNGYRLTDTVQDADVILFNTCSVRQHAEDKVWSELGRMRQLKKKKTDLIIGVIGCMAKNLENKIIERMPHVDLAVSSNDLTNTYDYVENILNKRQHIVAVDSEQRDKSFYKNLYHQDKKHCYVNISEGCSNFCSYCIVPYVRGIHRSRLADDILKEVKQLIKDKVNSITLLGQNVNDYSYRPKTKDQSRQRRASPKAGLKTRKGLVDFVGLVEIISEIKGIKELSFLTSHPKDVDFRLFDLMAQKKNIKKYLHLPVQSGSNRILKLMNRGYTRKRYFEIIEQYRKKVPNGILATDIIVGFPTETEKDFNETLGLLKKIEFNFSYIFKYSPRPHTKARDLADDVSKEEKKRRHGILLSLQKDISRRKRKS